LDEATVERLDGWAVMRGVSRPELVKAVLAEWLRRQEREHVAAEYRRAYEEHPETDEELASARESARQLVEEEPWTRWW